MKKEIDFAEIVYADQKHDKHFTGEGIYALVYKNEIKATHYCSNRDFANHDLTVWVKDVLDDLKINSVYSNNKLVWQRDNKEINNITQDHFLLANMRYENENCGINWNI